MGKIKITQVRSLIKRPKQQKAVIKALGLGRINKSVLLDDIPSVCGMLKKVGHLVVIERI